MIKQKERLYCFSSILVRLAEKLRKTGYLIRMEGWNKCQNTVRNFVEIEIVLSKVFALSPFSANREFNLIKLPECYTVQSL